MMTTTWTRFIVFAGALVLLGASGLALAHEQQDRLPGPVEARPQPRFAAYDIVVDAGEAKLGAYQIEIVAPGAGVAFVGVEGGEHEAYRDPPFYDPRALQDGERIVIAAFSTLDELPSGRVRIARLHVQEMPRTNDAPVDWTPSVIVAGDADGDEIEISVQVVRADGVGAKGEIEQ